MCGRYGRRADKQRIAEWMQTHDTNVFDDTLIAPSFNVAPQTFQPVVRLNQEGQRELTMMRWGLVPYWSKDGKMTFSTINAKAETVAKSPTYREAWKRRRCLIPAEWFYEWQKPDEKTKPPYAISLKDDSMFAFAGLWESWKNKESGERLNTYTIMTTDSNQLVEPIHNRMPVILSKRDYERWMAPADPAHLPVDLLKPYPAEEMKAWKISRAVGNVRNDDPELITPIPD
jgi:putative SOS response-associated peptidase YedK